MTALGLFFGWPAGAVWSNLVASAICAGIVWWRLRARLIHQHVQAMILATRNHHDRTEQAERHHRALLELHRRNHQQVLDQAAGHHSDLKARVAAAAQQGGDRP